MRFETALPIGVLAILPLLVIALAVFAYRHAAGLARPRRAVLVALRAATLGIVVWCLLRPVVPRPSDTGDGVVVVLVDASGSMALRDAAGLPRIERAVAVLNRDLLPTLKRTWRVETMTFGDRLAPMRDAALAATADRTDLAGAVTGAADSFRGRGLAGIVLLSDGGDTTGADLAHAGERAGVPVVTIGVGTRDSGDRAIAGVVAGQSSLDASLVDLSVTLASHGLPGRVELRLLQDGRVVEKRPVTLTAGDTSVREVFTVAPERQTASVFTVDVAEAQGELTAGNNAASVLVPPPGRRRRVLVLEGAPGFEHTFVKRAWTEDPSLEVDSVVRKGRNEQGVNTFFVQASGDRTTPLAGGFPQSREALYVYDTVALANYDAHDLSTAQLDSLRAFVSERGGGLLVFGARSFDTLSVGGTPLEDLLPLRLGDAAGVRPAAAASGGAINRVRPTAEGERHPVMRIAAADDESMRRWAALPALPSYVRLAGPRPGASILATTEAAGTASLPVVAVQRFGAGRTMVFTGEASWRWKMQMPVTDQSYDRFWRQAARWLSADALDPIVISAPAGSVAGQPVDVPIVVRDAMFRPAGGDGLRITLEAPDGMVSTIAPTLVDRARGQFVARVRPATNGVYRIQVESSGGAGTPGAQTGLRWLVGGRNRELADPRLNEVGLRRLAEASGARYLTADAAGGAAEALAARRDRQRPLEWRPAWHSGWVFALIVAFVSTEWFLRRRWGLR